ncbi:hypothetical protein DITRI_Ditri14bG0059000 [Diplodiscus trichospermus]
MKFFLILLWAEYGIGTGVTTRGDMYSFGMLLLERFTGKKPTDDIFKDGLTLHHFAKMALSNQVLEVVDPLLLIRDNQEQTANSSINPRRVQKEKVGMKKCLIAILSVGVACSIGSPTNRMDIVDVTRDGNELGFHGYSMLPDPNMTGLDSFK